MIDNDNNSYNLSISEKYLVGNCKTETIENWEELIQNFTKHANDDDRQWVFRGEKKKFEIPFQTSLERAFVKLGIKRKDRRNYETKLIREFKRKCHLFIENPPEEDRYLEWIALMRHYGAPTRTLDFTYSFFVAVYFALEEAEKNCYVWAIDSNWLNEIFHSEIEQENHKDDYECLNLKKRDVVVEKLITNKTKRLISAINPSRLNKRMVLQQGVFLYPGDIEFSFLENLRVNFSLLKANSQDKIIRYEIKIDEKNDILKKLNYMNINRNTLYPGLDGFSKSLGILPKFPI